jgi:hypothetical protein
VGVLITALSSSFSITPSLLKEFDSRTPPMFLTAFKAPGVLEEPKGLLIALSNP